MTVLMVVRKTVLKMHLPEQPMIAAMKLGNLLTILLVKILLHFEMKMELHLPTTVRVLPTMVLLRTTVVRKMLLV